MRTATGKGSRARASTIGANSRNDTLPSRARVSSACVASISGPALGGMEVSERNRSRVATEQGHVSNYPMQ